MIIEEITAKSLVKKTGIDDWWWTEASMNPYRGCYHDCVYCDGKSEGYYMHSDFGNRIQIKINSPALLENFLRKLGFSPVNRDKTSTLADFFPGSKASLLAKQPPKFILGIGGGVCDVYQPAERKMRVTRKLLEIARDYRFPVQLLTKSSLVLRDIDILSQLPYANVSFSITLCDEKDRKIIEPRSSSTGERFEAMKTLIETGIHSGAFFLPILPWIGDTSDNLECLYSRAKDAGAEYAIPSGLTLKPGR
ncbi:MAG: radical SAM protein, partial [Candidatus Hodarchaeales archaeon]